MGLLLSPGALLIVLLVIAVMFKWVGLYVFMMVPEILAFTVTSYAIGIASKAYLDWKATGGLPEGLSRPHLNPFDNLYVALDAMKAAVPRSLRFWPLLPFLEEIGPVVFGFMAFTVTFVAAMAVTGEWAHYMATGTWAPALPVGLSLTAGIATFATLFIRDAMRS